MRILLTLAALALLPGCAYWSIDSRTYQDGSTETHITESWCCTDRPNISYERRVVVPKTVDTHGEVSAMSVSMGMAADSDRSGK